MFGVRRCGDPTQRKAPLGAKTNRCNNRRQNELRQGATGNSAAQILKMHGPSVNHALRLADPLLGVDLGPNPQGSEDNERDGPDSHRRRKAEIEVAIGVIHGVMQQLIPDQQAEDRQSGHQKKREEAGTGRQEQAGKETEALERKA